MFEEELKPVAFDLYHFYVDSGISHEDSVEKLSFILLMASHIYPIGLVGEIVNELNLLSRERNSL